LYLLCDILYRDAIVLFDIIGKFSQGYKRMKIESRAMGEYQTNCYIVHLPEGELIVDPGVGAVEWVLSKVETPIAILDTHGHFDHVWSVSELASKLKIPVYIHRDDAFLLAEDLFGMGMPTYGAPETVSDEKKIKLGGADVVFRHFPGHTPGCCVIEIGDVWFSGDFLFRGSIGRWDLPYSDPSSMLSSLKRVSKFEGDYTLYPGHGGKTTLEREKRALGYWIEELKRYS
jgi:glyoxylase-like metal-dependent hydrolase (beta-lactamase superfamily II)